MENLNTYIIEKFKISKNIKVQEYNYHPKNEEELRRIVRRLLIERGPDADLNDIDVSGLTKLSPFEQYKGSYTGLFENLDPHNIDISSWDVSNSTGFGAMFYGCKNFNCDLSNWDMSKAKYINTMFQGCKSFEGKGIKDWKIKNTAKMAGTFEGCDEKIIPDWYYNRKI